MSPESSSTGDAIDKYQIKLDTADGVSDSRIDVKNEKGETSTEDKLTAVYIGRVNDLQGRIEEARRTVDIAKNARAPHWQQLDKICSEVEKGLLQKFAEVNPETITAAAEEFDREVQTLIATLTSGMQKQSGELNADAPDKNTEKLRAAREAAKDRSKSIQRDIDALKGREENFLKQLAKETKDGSYNFLDLLTSKIAAAEKGIQLIVDEIKRLRLQIQEQTTELQKVEGLAMTLEVMLVAREAQKDDLAGRTEEADRRRTLLLEKYGENLKDIDATLAERATESAKRLKDDGKLSETETALLFGDPRSPEALKKAVEDKMTESGDADIVDQVRAKQTFRAGTFEKYAPTNVFYNGQDVSGAIAVGARTTLTYSDGKTLNVIATQGAQKVLENIPSGKEPVLLRPISSINMTGGVGRGNTRLTLKNAPADFTVRQGDIGFVDASGNIVEDDGKTPIDLSQNAHKATIEAQIRNQKGFRLETYRSKFPLKTLDGKPYPYGLNSLKTQSGVTVEGVTVAQDAIKLINAEPPQGQTLVLKRIPRAISLRTPEVYGGGPKGGGTTIQRVLDADMIRREDLAYAKIEGDTLTTQNVGSEKKTETSVSGAEKEQEEKTRDIQRVLDRNPAIHGVKRAASTIQQTTGNLQKFLEASKAGSAREAFVKFTREEAKPTLAMLNDPKLKQDIDQARSVLLQLKRISGVALGGLEKQIDAQLKALDGFTAMLIDGRTQNLLETIMDASKFDADTWANFFKNELPVIAASIVLACAAAALVVVTCGTATPFIAIAGATALGGVVGAELGKEAVYAGHQLLDDRVRSGEATFTERSKTGKYVEGQKLFNEQTGRYEDREFFRDVGNPLAQEFAQAFVVTLATMGIGNLVGARLSQLLQNSKIVDRLTARSDILKAVARKLANLNQQKEVLEKATGLKDAIARALKTLPKEVGEEFGDEAQESILEKFLNQLDLSLAASDGVNGKIGLGTAAAMLLAIAKNTRIGKATISYEISGKDPKTVQNKAQAIRAEAEANGAIVTDLGKGVLSIRHPVEVNGKVEYETVQMMPAVSIESDVEADQAPIENTENQAPIDAPQEIQSDQGALKALHLKQSQSGPRPISDELSSGQENGSPSSVFDPFGDSDSNSPFRVRSRKDIDPASDDPFSEEWENTGRQASRESYVSSDDFWNLAGTEGVTEQQLSDLLQRTDVGNVWLNMINRELRSRLSRDACKPAQLVQVFSAARSFFAMQKAERYTDRLRAEAEYVVAFLLQRKSGWNPQYVAADAAAALDIARECQIPISEEMKQAAEARFESFATEHSDLAVAFATTFSVSVPSVRTVALGSIGRGTLFTELQKMEGLQLENDNPDVQKAAAERVTKMLYWNPAVDVVKGLRDTFAIPADMFREAATKGLLHGLQFRMTLEQFLALERELDLTIDIKDAHAQEEALTAFDHLILLENTVAAVAIRDHFGLQPMAAEETRGHAVFAMQEHVRKGEYQEALDLQAIYKMSDIDLQNIATECVEHRYQYLSNGTEKKKADQWCQLLETNGLLSAEAIKSAKKNACVELVKTASYTGGGVALEIAADIQEDSDYILNAAESKEKLSVWHQRHLEDGDMLQLNAVGHFFDLSALDADPAAHEHARTGIRYSLSRGRRAAIDEMRKRYGIQDVEYREDVRSSIITAHAERWEDTAKRLASEYDMEDVRTGPEAKARRIGNILLSLHWGPDPRKELQKEVAKYVASTKKQLAHDNFTDADIESALGKELIQHLQRAKEENLEYVRQIAQNFDIRNLVQQPDVMDAVRGLLSKNTFDASQEIMKLMHVDPDLESCIPFMEEGSKNRMIAEACGAKTVQEFFELRPSFEYMKETVLQLLSLTPRERRIDYAKVILELHNDDVSSDMRKTRQELTALIVETDDPAAALASIQAIYAGTGSLISKVCLTYDALHPHRKITLSLDQYDLPFLQQLDGIAPDNRAAYVPIFQRVSNSPSEEIKRVQDQIIQLILTCDDPLAALEKIESVFVKNNIPMIGKIYRVFEILHPTEILDSRITDISSPFLQQASNARRRTTIYRDLMKAHVLSGNRNLRGFLEVLQGGERIIGMLDDPTKTLTASERKQVTYALMKFETLFEHSQTGKQSGFVAERISGDLTDADIRSRYQSLRQSLGVQEQQSLHDRIVQMFAAPLGLHSVDEVLETMRDAKNGAHERNIQAASKGLFLAEGDFIKGVKEEFIGNIFQNGSVAVEYLGADSGSDGTPFDTDVSIVAKEDVSEGFSNVINHSIGGSNNTYGNILLVVKNRNQFQVTDNETTDFDSGKYELFPIGLKHSHWSRHGGVRTGFPSTEIDLIVAKKDLDPRDRQNLFFEIVKNGFYIPVTDVEGNIIFTPEMYGSLRKSFDGLERFEGNPLTVSSETNSRHARDIDASMQEVLAQRAPTHEQMAHIESVVSDVLSEYGTELKSVYDTSLGGVRLEDTGSTGRGTQLSGSSDFDFVLKLDSSAGEQSLFAKSEEIAQKIQEKLQPNEVRVEPAPNGGKQLRAFGCQNCGGVDIDIAFIPSSDVSDFGSHNAVAEKLRWIAKHEGQDAHDRTVANIVLAKKLLKAGNAYKKQEHGGIGGIGVENWILSNECNALTAFRSFMNAAVDSKGAVVPLEDFKQRYGAIDPGVNIRFGTQGENFFRGLTEGGYRSMIAVIAEYTGTRVASETKTATDTKTSKEESKKTEFDIQRKNNSEVIRSHENAIRTLIGENIGRYKKGDIGVCDGIGYEVTFRGGKQQPVVIMNLTFADGQQAEVVLRPIHEDRAFFGQHQESSALKQHMPEIYFSVDVGNKTHILVVEKANILEEHVDAAEYQDLVDAPEGMQKLAADTFEAIDELYNEPIRFIDVVLTSGHNIGYNKDTNRFQFFDVDTPMQSADSHAFKFVTFINKRLEQANPKETVCAMHLLRLYDQKYPGVLDATITSAADRAEYARCKGDPGSKFLQNTPNGEIIPPGSKRHENIYATEFGKLPAPGENFYLLKIPGFEECTVHADMLDAARKGDEEAFQRASNAHKKTIADIEFKKSVAANPADSGASGQEGKTQKLSDSERAARLEYMKKNDVADPERLKIAGDLLGIDLDLPEHKQERDAILDAHNHGTGNLEDGYSPEEIIEKGKILMRSGLTREQAQLLLDTGVCGIAFLQPIATAPHNTFIDKQLIEVTDGANIVPPGMYVMKSGIVDGNPQPCLVQFGEDRQPTGDIFPVKSETLASLAYTVINPDLLPPLPIRDRRSIEGENDVPKHPSVDNKPGAINAVSKKEPDISPPSRPTNRLPMLEIGTSVINFFKEEFTVVAIEENGLSYVLERRDDSGTTIRETIKAAMLARYPQNAVKFRHQGSVEQQHSDESKLQEAPVIDEEFLKKIVGKPSRVEDHSAYEHFLDRRKLEKLTIAQQRAIVEAHSYSDPSLRMKMEEFADVFCEEEMQYKQVILLASGIPKEGVSNLLEHLYPEQSRKLLDSPPMSQATLESIIKNVDTSSLPGATESPSGVRRKITAIFSSIWVNANMTFIMSGGALKNVSIDGKLRTVLTAHIPGDPKDPISNGGGAGHEGNSNVWYQIFAGLKQKYKAEGKELKVITREMIESLNGRYGEDSVPRVSVNSRWSPQLMNHHRVMGALNNDLSIEVTIQHTDNHVSFN